MTVKLLRSVIARRLVLPRSMKCRKLRYDEGGSAISSQLSVFPSANDSGCWVRYLYELAFPPTTKSHLLSFLGLLFQVRVDMPSSFRFSCMTNQYPSDNRFTRERKTSPSTPYLHQQVFRGLKLENLNARSRWIWNSRHNWQMLRLIPSDVGKMDLDSH